MKVRTTRKILHFISIIGIALTIWLTIYFLQSGVFTDPTRLSRLVGNNIYLAPIIFIFIQIIQVVVPIIPGGITNAAGVMIFGPIYGLIYNYIGNVIGSVILFLLGRKYGKMFVLALIGEKAFDKYIGKIGDSKKWSVFFTFMMFFPLSPDDALVLMNALTNMSFKKYMLIMSAGKLVSVASYSYMLVAFGHVVASFM
ncbi:MAG: VTT domain-containing protein [Streptococcaceae bacterium]|nr:VTT domain-containing protein [Streptococcaceae bacterium]